MRKEGAVFSMTRERNLDLLRAYRETLYKCMETDEELVYMNILRATVNSPASRYWVSVERASSVIYQMNKGIPVKMKENSRFFYESLFREFKEYRETHPDMPIKHIISIVIERPAPCFVLAPESAKSIISKMKKECYQQRLRRLRHCL